MSLQISAQRVKELRSQTGAGMIDCKKALKESKGDIKIAIENLRKKGLALADKKSGRIAVEGIVESYIHAGSKIGVLVEINCETDFVARHADFHKLAKNIAMQIAACPSVQYVSVDEISADIVDNEKRIEASKDDVKDKPENIKNKIVAGRLEKRLKEMSLIDQLFIKDQNISVEELIKQHIALLGENIKVRRFTKFILGEGLPKKTEDFVSEVTEIIQNV